MQDPPLLRNIPPRSQHNFITFHWSVCLWFYITEPTLQNNFQSKVIHFVLKSSIFVNDGKSQKHNGISWFSKIAIFKKNVMSQMNTDGIRGFWLHALASLCIVHWSQEGKFSAQYRVSNNKMELSLRYWGLYDHIYGMSVCMIASMDHLDMLRVTNGAFSPLSGFVWSHLWDDCLYDRIYRPSGHVTCYQWSILSAIGMTVNGAKTWQNQTQSLQSVPTPVKRGHSPPSAPHNWDKQGCRGL